MSAQIAFHQSPLQPTPVSLQFRFGPYTLKRAASDDEMAQLHRLNYRTFVREIPQHHDPGDDRLIDKFHHKNRYIIAKRGDTVVGMVAVHDQPPFSVADRLHDPADLEKLGGPLLEVRLLAIEPNERHRTLFVGLLWAVYRYARSAGYAQLIISGVRQRAALYRRFGFRPLGPATRSGDAYFVPMHLSLVRPTAHVRSIARRWEEHAGLTPLSDDVQRISLLPGPVQIAPHVRDAFATPPISHRSPELITAFEECRAILSDLVGGHDASLLCGSGTLANEAVALALATSPGMQRGLIVSNGEFGERLVALGRRAGLAFDVSATPWGCTWDLDDVRARLARGGVDWLWAVHSESSTGVLNPLPELAAICREYGTRLCVDCISSLGAIPLDLRGVHLAAGSSGKALGAYAGISFVFSAPGLDWNGVRGPIFTTDLSSAIASRGPRFTFPSPQVLALRAALEVYATPERRGRRFAALAALGAVVRNELEQIGVAPLANFALASPVLTTFAPPREYTPWDFSLLCRACGYEINAVSPYLVERGLVQVATMGEIAEDDLRPLFQRLQAWIQREQRGSTGKPAY